MPGGSPVRAAWAAPVIILPHNGVFQAPVLRAGVDTGAFGAARYGQRVRDTPVFTDRLLQKRVDLGSAGAPPRRFGCLGLRGQIGFLRHHAILIAGGPPPSGAAPGPSGPVATLKPLCAACQLARTVRATRATLSQIITEGWRRHYNTVRQNSAAVLEPRQLDASRVH